MKGLRKAALYLHGLEEADRRWLLDALSEEERECLQTAINELIEMDVPSDSAWLPELAEAQAMETNKEQSSHQSSNIDAIERADLSSLIQVFEDEPDSIVALLLKHRVWSWRQAYVNKQYLEKRERLLRALETSAQPLKEKVEVALINALATKLSRDESISNGGFETALVAAQHNTDQRSFWRRLWRR